MRVIFAMLCCIVSAHAESAVSYMGLCNPTWNCEGTLDTWDNLPEIRTGWLEQSFGTECKCANMILASPKPKTVRVHLMNSACMRNKRCGPQEILYRETVVSATAQVFRNSSPLMRRFRRVMWRAKRRLVNGTKPLRCYVSPCLECDLNAAARKILLRVVRRGMPFCSRVDNPHHDRCLPKAVCEVHGHPVRGPDACIADLDGTDGATVPREAYVNSVSQCRLKFWWQPWMNCNSSMPGTFIDPTLRSCYQSSTTFRHAGRIAWEFLGQ